MRCADLTILIEPIAAGEVVPDDDMAAHLAACSACAADLALARRIVAREPVTERAAVVRVA
jgi:hypothetical protein